MVVRNDIEPAAWIGECTNGHAGQDRLLSSVLSGGSLSLLFSASQVLQTVKHLNEGDLGDPCVNPSVLCADTKTS